MLTTLSLPFVSSEQIEKFAALPDEDKQVSLMALYQTASFLKEIELSTHLVASFTGAVDSEGTVYDKIEFLVDARYTVTGDVWISGDGYCINVDKFCRGYAELIASPHDYVLANNL